jgi:signal transduction histidine kinase/DNA-binding NarL/FixJ family response regulator
VKANVKFLIAAVFYLFVSGNSGFAVPGGYKFIKNFSPGEYNSQPQNWSILQDRRGLIYVANQKDVLVFDGVSWRHIPIPNLTARSLAGHDSGTIYVGGKNELGFLASAGGDLKYVSLLHHLEEKKRNFGAVWKTHATKDGIYFYTAKYLFRWNPAKQQMKTWEPKPGFRFNASFVCNGEYFVHQRRVGLMKMENDSLTPVPGRETFAAMKLYMMAPYGDGRMLIGTRSKGFFLFDGLHTVPFPTAADNYLKEKQLYHGIRLSSGEFALATRLGGVVIIDTGGGLKHIFDKAYGLLDDSIKYIFEDSGGNLWMGLNKGITRIEYVSPFRFYDDRSGLPGLVLSVQKHRGTLYAGTYSGLFYLDAGGSFKRAGDISSTCWWILPMEESLLIATIHGVFRVERSNGNHTARRLLDAKSFVLLRSRVEPANLWAGTDRGLVRVLPGLSPIEGVTAEIRTMAEDSKGNLWLGLRTRDVMRVTPRGRNAPLVTRFGNGHGLPAGEAHVFYAAGHIMIAADNGLYRFDETRNRFVPDTTLGARFAGGSHGQDIFRIVEGKSKIIWFHSQKKNYRAVPGAGGGYLAGDKSFRRLRRMQVNHIYPGADGNTVWFAGHDGIVRFDTNIKRVGMTDYAVLIRSLLVNGEAVYHGGAGNDDTVPVFDYRRRNLRFTFAAPFFKGEEFTRYQWLLEGYDEDWSQWSRETQKDYTNVEPGASTFRVRARNIYGDISREALFRFEVLPPWYRTWWAYLLYVLATFSAVFFIVRRRSRKLEHEKVKLEHIIHERTREIEDKNRQLEVQSEKLKDLDSIKSRFFANISHEFRTPLTLILGPLEQMVAQCPDDEKEKKQRYTLMLRNAQRLLRLINQLLDLSRLDSGKLKLQAVKTDIITFVKGIASSFELLARQNELNLDFETGGAVETPEQGGKIEAYIDPQRMEDVMTNLLINAVKFTPQGGRITVNVDAKPGQALISVKDTGAGIPPEQLGSIFDRFYQAEGADKTQQKGSGIGLALVKELVELHRGELTAESKEGRGSCFTISLPIGAAHLEPGELASGAGTRKQPYLASSSLIPDRAAPPEPPDETPAPEEEAEDKDIKDTRDIILVVEDNADVRTYIRSSLQSLYTVVEAAEGGEGLQKAQDIIPDLIISDVMMPGMDGYELCKTLKHDKATSHIPVILLTARASEGSILEGLQTGADDYITKPFSTPILQARIKNLIELRRILQQTLHRELTRRPVKLEVSPIDREFLKDLKTVIDENIDDPDFNVEGLCKKLYMSRPTVYRKIQALSGESPTEFIRSYRLNRAEELLRNNFGSVLEVALETGFSSANYFTKCFKKKFHQLPSTYQVSQDHP